MSPYFFKEVYTMGLASFNRMRKQQAERLKEVEEVGEVEIEKEEIVEEVIEEVIEEEVIEEPKKDKKKKGDK